MDAIPADQSELQKYSTDSFQTEEYKEKKALFERAEIFWKVVVKVAR